MSLKSTRLSLYKIKSEMLIISIMNHACTTKEYYMIIVLKQRLIFYQS